MHPFRKHEGSVIEKLIGVSGIGPKTALNILSGITVTAFRGAVAGNDTKMLSQISGVGKKTAERIIIELKDKIGPGGVLGRGLRTIFVRLLGAERLHYEVRSKTFKAR